MIQEYSCSDDVTFLQTANPAPSIDFGWQGKDYSDSAEEVTTFVQTANPAPAVKFGWTC